MNKPNKPIEKSEIERGLRALDAVKHCQEKMGDDEHAHDFDMRRIPPTEWTTEDIIKAEETAASVNNNSRA